MDVVLKQGDCRELSRELPDNSVDLICTDPPWFPEFMHLYEGLAKIAQRVLKPGGFLAAYCGHVTVPDALDRLRKHLDYYWIAAILHAGTASMRKDVKVFTSGHMVLFFQKPPRTKPPGWIQDVIRGGKCEKSNHPWQQPLIESKKLIAALSRPGELVLDPFAGAATTLLAARELNRSAIGYELDQATFEVAQQCLARIK